MTQKLGDHAVVLGSSMAGLVTARVLADFYDTVTVVERDVLPTEPVSRRGVPQGRMIHVLQARGAEILEELLPGLTDELAADGVPRPDAGDFSKFVTSFSGHVLGGGTRSTKAGTIVGINPTRPLLEWHVRRRVRAIPNVTILEGHDVAEFLVADNRKRVTGARVVNRDTGAETSLEADLVVDATGRGSRTPVFLEEFGYERPPEDELMVHLTYACQPLRLVPGALREEAVGILPMPGRPRLMVLAEYENGTWMFAVGGMAGINPPKDLEARLEFIADFTPSHVVEAIRGAEQLQEVAHYRVPSNRWRRYDKLRSSPDGLLVIGDAVCSFNPIYGQGMSVAAMEAIELRELLRHGTNDLPRRYFRRTAKTIRMAWRTTVAADLSLPEIEGPRPVSFRLTNALMESMLKIAENDADCAVQFFRIIQMVDSPFTVLRPSFLFRAARASVRSRRLAAARQPATSAVSS